VRIKLNNTGCDGQTDGHVAVAKTRLLRRAGKNDSKLLMKYKRITKVIHSNNFTHCIYINVVI